MKSRMLPIESVFSRLPRVVRDVAAKQGKQIDFIVEGKDTELDRSVVEEIGDPLLHLIRNGVDHGIETAEERHALGKCNALTLTSAALIDHVRSRRVKGAGPATVSNDLNLDRGGADGRGARASCATTSRIAINARGFRW